ncbi:MAG: type II toxin-antitoxin system RelE/ParE family toxin [Terracidiphilus sp.]
MRWSLTATSDLASIRKYIAKDNPAAAQRIAKRIKEAATAAPQLLYPESTTFKWLFPQGKATIHDAKQDT